MRVEKLFQGSSTYREDFEISEIDLNKLRPQAYIKVVHSITKTNTATAMIIIVVVVIIFVVFLGEYIKLTKIFEMKIILLLI